MRFLSDLAYKIKVKVRLEKPVETSWWQPQQEQETVTVQEEKPRRKVHVRGLGSLNRELCWLALANNIILTFGIYMAGQKFLALIFILNSYVIFYLLFKTRKVEKLG